VSLAVWAGFMQCTADAAGAGSDILTVKFFFVLRLGVKKTEILLQRCTVSEHPDRFR